MSTGQDILGRQAIEALIPHRAGMCLLSRVIAADADSVIAEVDVDSESLFHRATGTPAWVGLEYMAQAVAAWAGTQHRHGAPSPGYLLGTRRYHCTVDTFAPGQTLRVHARCELRTEAGLGQFACELRDSGNQVIAHAVVTVYEPTLT